MQILAKEIREVLEKYSGTKVCMCAHDKICEGCNPDSLFCKLYNDIRYVLIMRKLEK